jgi:hypothetical protein
LLALAARSSGFEADGADKFVEIITFTRNTMAMAGQHDATFTLYPQLTPLQSRAFEFLQVAVNV